MHMKRISLFFEELQLKRLDALSDKTGAPVAELIRRAVDALLSRAPSKVSYTKRNQDGKQ